MLAEIPERQRLARRHLAPGPAGAPPMRPDGAVPGAIGGGPDRSQPAGAPRVRSAGSGNVGTAVDLVAQVHGESGFARFPFAADKVAAARRYLGQPGRAALLLAERAGAATSLCVSVADELLTSHAKVGTVLILYVRPAVCGSQGRSRWPLRLLLCASQRSPYSALYRASTSSSIIRWAANWIISDRKSASEILIKQALRRKAVVGHRDPLPDQVVVFQRQPVGDTRCHLTSVAPLGPQALVAMLPTPDALRDLRTPRPGTQFKDTSMPNLKRPFLTFIVPTVGIAIISIIIPDGRFEIPLKLIAYLLIFYICWIIIPKIWK